MTQRERKELAAAIYADALKKLEHNMRRHNDQKADDWATLAAGLEVCYGLKRPERLR